MSKPARIPPLPPPSCGTLDRSSKFELKDLFPSVVLPFKKGYLEKGSGEGKSQFWDKKFVEVSDGKLTFRQSRKKEHNDDGIELPLMNSYVSVQERTVIRIETEHKVRFFRASSQSQAYKWAHVIARYCAVPPTAEGPCEKLSHRKPEFQTRYLKLTGDGVLQWYEKEEDTKSKGAVMIKGEMITSSETDPTLVFVKTSTRNYEFKFLDKTEADLWMSALLWYSKMTREHTNIEIRN